MILGPLAVVDGTVAVARLLLELLVVVAHHPVVVELEGVALRLLAVDEDAASVVYGVGESR